VKTTVGGSDETLTGTTLGGIEVASKRMACTDSESSTESGAAVPRPTLVKVRVRVRVSS